MIGSPAQNAGGEVPVPALGAAPEAPADVARRPRIAIMGEFSAGKSTLTNLLMGAQALPVRVTATQLPPVWLRHGTASPIGVGLDGQTFPVDLENSGAIPLTATRHILVERPASVLEMCDLLDFPGISDPNMPAEVWERAAPLADGVLWLTHATQAWRQSEAAFWEAMPEELRGRSLLLLTRFDKITGERDQRRVLARVRRETEGLFAGVFPVSLTRAIAAGDDRSAFEASGAGALMDALLDTVTHLARQLGGDIPMRSAIAPMGDRELSDEVEDGCAEGSAPDATTTTPQIVPRRVRRPVGAARLARPSADEPRPSRQDLLEHGKTL